MDADLRIGHGFDAHRWSDDPGRPLVLGGVLFENGRGLAGHSDADVIAHACIDAILGAAGLGDIGTLFPDTEPELEGADSLRLLGIARSRIEADGWSVVNVDATVVLDEPKLAPHRPAIEANLSEAASGAVTVKAKTTEGLPGLTGGVQCHAVALLTRSLRR